jgi:hypothetical protein
MPAAPVYACPGAPWQGVTCDSATGRITHMDLTTNTPLCSTSPCQLAPDFFRTLTALVVFRIPESNVAADLSTLDLSESYMLEELDLSGSAGVTGPLSGSWPQWMPYLKSLSLSGATNLVGVRVGSSSVRYRFTPLCAA